jgi:outer membrane protein assembly factor BamB
VWTAPISGNPQSGAAVTNSSIFVATGTGNLYAFSRFACVSPCPPIWTGHFAAGFGDGSYGSLIVADGNVYVGNAGGSEVFAFSASGCGNDVCNPTWAYNSGGATAAGLAVLGDNLYVSAAGSGLASFARLCTVGTVCQPVWSDPAATGAQLLAANGVIYADTGTTILADAATDGSRVWTATAPASTNTPPTVANGKVYVSVLGNNQIVAYALTGDTDDNISPANTNVTANLQPGTKLTVSGSVDGVGVTVTCDQASASATTPAQGLDPVNLAAPPTYSSCTDNFGGTDTVTASGSYTLRFADAYRDEARESGDFLVLGIPQDGLTATSSVVPGCTVTAAPSGPVPELLTYDDNGTATTRNVMVPTSGSGCSVSSAFAFSEALTVSPAIKDAS